MKKVKPVRNIKSVKIILVLLLLSICLPSALFSEDRKVLAVPAIEAKGVSESIASTCRNILEAALIKTGAYSVMSYTDVEEILEAQAFSLSGCTDDSCAIEIGELLSAEKIVVGSLDGIGEAMVLTIRLVDVEKGNIEKAEVIDIDKLENLQRQSFTAAYNLCGLKYIAGTDLSVKEKGSLYITAPEGMELYVYLDGNRIGQTPIVINDVDFGVHVIKAESDEYVFENQINVNTTDVAEVIADNSLLRGNLMVKINNTEAEGYTISLGTIPLKTGLNRDLPVGSYSLKVQGNCWYYEGNAEINTGRTSAVSLSLIKGADVIITTPEQSSSRLISDDAVEYQFIEDLITVPPGTYILEFTHEDYQPYRESLSLQPGTVHEISPLLIHTEQFLTGEKVEELEAKRAAALEKRRRLNISMISSFSIAAASGIVSGIFEALIASEKTDLDSNYSAYTSATISSEAESLHSAVSANISTVESYRLYRNIALICSGTGAASGLTFLFVRPSINKIDEQIAALSEGAK